MDVDDIIIAIGQYLPNIGAFVTTCHRIRALLWDNKYAKFWRASGVERAAIAPPELYHVYCNHVHRCSIYGTNTVVNDIVLSGNVELLKYLVARDSGILTNIEPRSAANTSFEMYEYIMLFPGVPSYDYLSYCIINDNVDRLDKYIAKYKPLYLGDRISRLDINNSPQVCDYFVKNGICRREIVDQYIRLNNVSAIKNIFEKYCSIEEHGTPALLTALQYNRREIVEFLVAAGAKIDYLWDIILNQFNNGGIHHT